MSDPRPRNFTNIERNSVIEIDSVSLLGRNVIVVILIALYVTVFIQEEYKKHTGKCILRSRGLHNVSQ